MTLNPSNGILERRWLERKSQILNNVRKNISGFFFLNSFIGYFFLRFSLDPLGIKFPTTGFLWFMGGYFFLTVIVRLVVDSYERQENKSRKLRYLILMAWQNLFILILGFFVLSLGISTWIRTDVIQISILGMGALIVLIIFSLSLWSMNRAIRRIKSFIDVTAEKKQLPRAGYYWIIGVLILVTNLVAYIFTIDIQILILMVVSLGGGIVVIYISINRAIWDYLFLMNGYLE
jgi:hypothetical protein